MEKRIRVGITHGDINGIGYEAILKTFSDPVMLELCTPIIYGSPKIATFHRKALDLSTSFLTIDNADKVVDGKLNMIDCFDDQEVKVEFGQCTTESGLAALCSLERAMKDYQDGAFDVLVTCPVNKHGIQQANFNFQGHAEYLEEKVGEGDNSLLMLVHDKIRVALATTHIPVKDLAQSISKELVKEKVMDLHETLKRDFRIDNPVIAVLGLNPHAGDECLIGMEETDKINPALQELKEDGFVCYGPFAADSFFGSNRITEYDGVLCLFHDQGMIAFKAMTQGEGVMYTAGLPLVRTAPIYGTCYEVAGKNLLDEQSFRQAIYTALDIYRNQRNYDYAERNPLRKVYHERRDDSDKLKLD